MERLETDALQVDRDRVVDLPQWFGVSIEHLVEHLGAGLPGEGATSREQLIEEDSQGPDIGAAVHVVRQAPDLFRGHVGWCSGDFPGVVLLDAFVDGQPEVGHIRHAAIVQQDIAGLQVAMDESLGVSVVYGVRDLGDQRCHFAIAHPIGRVFDVQWSAIDEVHDNEASQIAIATHIMNGHDIRMFQLGRHPRFFQEPADIMLAREQPLARDLDGHQAIQLRILGQHDASEASLGDQAEDRVATNVFR